MLKCYFQAGLGTGLVGAAAIWFGVLGTGAASAADSPPHVDVTQPHEQVYPETAQAGGEQGTVLVQVYVHPNGKIAKYNVAQSSGFGDLDAAALQSVLNWRFVPAMRGGDPVSDWAVVKVVYQLPQTTAQNSSPPG